MKPRVYFILIISIILSCEGRQNPENKIVGKWKITDCYYFKDNSKDCGLRNDYYKLDIGRIIEYRTDMHAEWIAIGKSFPYSLNLKDSIIQFKNKSVRLIKLTDTQLIIREVARDSASLTTSFIKVK